MEREVDLLNKLAEFLIAHGYPEESLAVDWKVGKKRRADLAVLDPQTGLPVAVFELKRERNPSTLSLAQSQLVSLAAELGDPSVPMYAVFPRPDGEGFELHRVADAGDARVKERSLTPVPEFRLLRSTVRLNAAAKVSKERRKSIDHLAWLSWLLAVVVAVVTVLDFAGKIALTAERVGLIVLVAGLAVLPFASKLKILGLEFERFKKMEERSE